MGGSSGGGLTEVDLSKLTNAAEQRLRELLSGEPRLLFVCEPGDERALTSHLNGSKVFDREKYSLLSNLSDPEVDRAVEKCTVVIVFTDATQNAENLNKVVDTCLKNKKYGVHAQGRLGAPMPSKVMAYRWPSLTWDALEAMFA